MASIAVTPINIGKLFPHPDNPRKDLGDLSELTESIRKNGLMQNLTVFPQDDSLEKFTVLIGHRRLAAAKEAGLLEVPCRILFDPPSPKEQISIMLEENMQRNDLTIPEQAQGFQMMLDLGYDEDDIAEKTGFSRTTVRHRLQLAKLDQKTLDQKIGEFQLSLTDLYELEKIPNLGARDSILKNASSSQNLRWTVNNWLETEEKRKWLEKVKDFLIRKGVKQSTKDMDQHPENYKKETLGTLRMNDKLALPKGADNTCYYRVNDWDRSVAIFRAEKADTSERERISAERMAAQKARNIIEHQTAGLRGKMADFAKWLYLGAGTKELKDDEETYTLMKLALHGFSVTWPNIIGVVTGKMAWNLTEEEKTEYNAELERKPLKLTAIISLVHWASSIPLIDYSGDYLQNNGETVRKVVEILEEYGFSVTEEERALIDGTDAAYIKE